MTDGTSQNPGVNGESGGSPTPKTYTDDEIKALKDSSAAAGRREAESKLKEANDRLTTFEAEEKKRVEAEMSENEKLQLQIIDLTKDNETIKADRDLLKSNVEDTENRIKEEVEKQLEGLTDEQKILVGKLPLKDQSNAIIQFKEIKPESGEWGKGNKIINENLTAAEAFEIRDKYGSNSLEYKKALEIRRKILGK